MSLDDDPEESYDPGPRYAEITQSGRWTYSIKICQGLVSWEKQWPVFGRQRAQKKAEKILAKEALEDQRRAEKTKLYL